MSLFSGTSLYGSNAKKKTYGDQVPGGDGLAPAGGGNLSGDSNSGDETINLDAVGDPSSTTKGKDSSWSYTGPAPWALDTYKALLAYAPGMVEKWSGAWEDLENVPGLIEEEKSLIPAATLANFGDYEDWRTPVRNAYAAKGMIDSTPAAAAESDLDKALYQQYDTDTLNSTLALDKILADHYATKASLAGEAVNQATNLAGLGRISQMQSSGENDTYTVDPLAKYELLWKFLSL